MFFPHAFVHCFLSVLAASGSALPCTLFSHCVTCKKECSVSGIKYIFCIAVGITDKASVLLGLCHGLFCGKNSRAGGGVMFYLH